MNRYVIVCDCGRPSQSPSWFPDLADGRHIIAVVDGDYVIPNYFRGSPPRGFIGYALKPNRFGERRDSLNLACPAGCTPKHPPILMSTAVHAVTQVAEGMRAQGIDLAEVDVLDGEWPATREDRDRRRRQVEAGLFGETYEGPPPKMVPQYTRRVAIPWNLFKASVSRLPKQRPRTR